MRRGGWVRSTIAVAITVTIGALVLATCGRDSTSEQSERRGAPGTTTTAPATTPTTVAPQTVPVPPVPPAPATTGPPPAITVPRSPRATTTTAATTTAPTTTTPTTASPTTTEPTVTTAPGSTTSRPDGATTTTEPAGVTRRTVVFSPPGTPKRRGDLVLPPDHEDTIVVLVHSLAEGRRSRKQMRGWADFYAEHGYPSFSIDYLVAKPSTPPPVYPKPEIDVKAAVQFLREQAGQLGVDPERIVVHGFSVGAALGAQAEVTPDDPFFDGTGHYPDVSDKPAAFVGFYGRYDGAQRDPERYYGGPPDSSDPAVQERYAKADSIEQAANAAGPALLVQGEDDDRDYVESATQLRDALQAAGKDVTLDLVAGAGHAFDHDKAGALTPAGEQAAQQVLDWLTARFPPSSS